MTKKNRIWVYEIDKNYPYEEGKDTGVRYILGEKFKPSIEKTLVCIGVNPSTATPEKLDATLKRVQNYAKQSGEYDAWYMLNIYPQRATNPNDMDKAINDEIHSKNKEHIRNLMENLPSADIWCAWGGSITKRKYLKNCLKDIIKCIQNVNNKSFKYVSKKAKDGKSKKHPLHPIASVKTEDKLEKFDVEEYLKTI